MHPSDSAFQTTLGLLLDERTDEGHFTGELSASALSTATAVSALSFYLNRKTLAADQRQTIEQTVEASIKWILHQQNEDGGWGDTDKNYSNISTTMLVEAAFAAAGVTAKHLPAIEIARQYVNAQGGVEALRERYGTDKTFAVPILANCAMAGIVPWKEVSALPFEAACVPQRFYNLMQLPVVSYAIPALVAIGQCKFVNDPPWDPIRKTIRSLAIGRSLNVLEKMQPASGGYLEAIPLTSFVAMALIESGRCDCGVVENSIRFLLESMRHEDESCCWPIDTNLATWGTTLAINGIANDTETFSQIVLADPKGWHQCFTWVLSCQNRSVHPFTGAAPGGWGWTDLSGAVPDADDTPGALIALKHIYDLIRAPEFRPALPEACRTDFGEEFEQQIISAADAGLKWLVDLQNRDRGWPTFCKGWGKLPFDRSGADLTAHAIRALHAWKAVPMSDISPDRIDGAVNRGFEFLRQKQHSEGYWLPLWFGNQDFPDDINPCYGTAKVLQAYIDCNLLDTRPAQIGLKWLVDHQNDDDGFGGGPSVQWNDVLLGSSTVEETALCAEALLGSVDPLHQDGAQRAVDWLDRAVRSDSIGTFNPIGFYFAKLWYHEKLYPLVFSIAALARQKSAMKCQHQNT